MRLYAVIQHNTLLVPFGDFVAVFRPTFIWYSFVNVAGRKKILSPQLFSWRILSGTSTMQKQFPLAFLFLSSQRSRKNRKKTLLGFSKNDAWYTTHCYEAHDLTYIKSLLLTPKKHTSKAKVNPCNQLLLKEQDHQAWALNIKKKFYFYSADLWTCCGYFYPSFEELLVYWVLHTWPHNGHVYSFVMTKESTQYYTKNL